MQITKFLDYESKPLALILDDHNLYAESFSVFLEKTGLFRQVHSFTQEETVVEFILKLTTKLRIILFADYYLRNSTALGLIKHLRQVYKPLHIVIVSCVTNPLLISDILMYPIDGFLSKSSNIEEIIACVQVIQDKKRYISPVVDEIVSKFNKIAVQPFSSRELEILTYFANGYTVNATAEKIALSRHTIVSHRRRMMTKTGTNTITELLAYARQLDLI